MIFRVFIESPLANSQDEPQSAANHTPNSASYAVVFVEEGALALPVFGPVFEHYVGKEIVGTIVGIAGSERAEMREG
jgi:hypothetical protein